MNVHKEILDWSKDRPNWQRDGLRRLVLNGELSEDDISELTEICKNAHGLSDHQEFIPLTEEHLPDKSAVLAEVALVSIFHRHGVNALAENQTLKFAPNLTIVYGDNAAGKTGYIRILKSACRTRGREKILGNVVSGSAPPAPVVAIKYKVGTEENVREWSGQGEDDFISRVSVFDTQCAAVYLTEKTDVAFRPFGLDLFDKLVQACKAVRLKLDTEQNSLASSPLSAVQPQFPEGTAVSKLLSGITSLTNPEKVHALAHLSPEENTRLELIEKSLVDLQANDTKKLIKQLELHLERTRSLVQHLKKIEKILSPEAIASVFNAQRDVSQKSEEAARLRAVTFREDILKGTGSELWTKLWESARRFSQELAYPDQQFPAVENNARCVLCQQELDHQTIHRLKQLESFVVSTAERQLRERKGAFEQLYKTIADLKIKDDPTKETLTELSIEHSALSDHMSAALENNERRRKSIVNSLDSGTDIDTACPALVFAASKAEELVVQLEKRIETLRGESAHEAKEQLLVEAQELRARKLLAQHERLVLDEIERKKKIAAYRMCIDDAKTQAITLKSSTVTRTVVTDKLKKSFKDELQNLSFRHIEVELREAGGAEGILYHKLLLTRAPGVELPKVVSEGEQRCLSIAAFFAELSTADESSGIIFDDPVSSLDYRWREGVARRLVEEAKRRQVIVFTHDIVFLLLLKQFSAEQCVAQIDQHIRQLSIGSGVCTEELPWVAQKASSRIGFLKRCLQEAEKLNRDGHLAAYEREASLIYGYLREAWERAIEEVLLGGIVERFRPSVQTQQILKIADITEDDCKTVEIAMTKCSKWLTGHDQAPAARAEIPDPSELKQDIEALESWISTIRKRRQ
ncbi:MAG: AAA family ATPase [Lentisphaerae bacterium]|nr:AAA family ATPase [Lentisphaerota bacterium]